MDSAAIGGLWWHNSYPQRLLPYATVQARATLSCSSSTDGDLEITRLQIDLVMQLDNAGSLCALGISYYPS